MVTQSRLHWFWQQMITILECLAVLFLWTGSAGGFCVQVVGLVLQRLGLGAGQTVVIMGMIYFPLVPLLAIAAMFHDMRAIRRAYEEREVARCGGCESSSAP